MKRNLKWVMVLAVSIAGLASMAGTAQAGWGPPADISSPVSDAPNASDDGQVAALPGGGFVYVWSRLNDDGSYDVVSRVSYPDGSLSPVNTVAHGFHSGSTSTDAYNPIVATGGGTIRVSWEYQDMFCTPSCDYRYRPQLAKLDADGKPVSVQALDSTPANSNDFASPPALSVAPDGSSLLAWRYYDDSTADISVKTAVVSSSFDPVSPVTAYTSPNPVNQEEVAAADGGGGFVTVLFGDPAKNLRSFMVDPSGAAGTLATLDPGPVDIDDFDALIGPDGKGTVVYEIPGQAVWMRKTDADGNPLGAGPVVVSDNGVDHSASFEHDGVAMASDGKIVVAFGQIADATLRPVQMVRTINTDGSLGSADTVENIPDGVAYNGFPAISPDGGGSVLYYAQAPSGRLQVRVRQLDASLHPAGTPVVLDQDKSDSTIFPQAIAYSDNGDAAALWEDFFEAQPDLGGLRSSIFETTPPTLDLWVQPKAVQDQGIVVGAEASDRSGVTVSWDLGDGGTATGNYVNHTFTAAGTFAVKATATDGAGNTTVKSASIEVLPKQGVTPPPDPVIPPDTKITAKPAKSTKAKAATFKFTSSLTGSKFECRLDKAGWSDCKSPKKLKKLKAGKHTFKVRANKGGLVDPTPASYTWTVKKPKKNKKGGHK